MTWPVELQVAVFGAASAGVGYGIRSAIDWRKSRRHERERTIAELQRLQSLLNAGHEVFFMQRNQVDRLIALLEQNHPTECENLTGVEEKMERCYRILNKTEKEIHTIIRSYTKHSMRSINLAVSEWLKSDGLFKTGVVKSQRKEQLAETLVALEIHLLLWHAKYEAWIPNHLEHAIVYMDDEKHHGLGFPGAKYARRPGSLNEEETQTGELSIESGEKDVAGAHSYADWLRNKNLIKIADGVDEHVASVLDELRGKKETSNTQSRQDTSVR
jgi:hypothetical protein